MTKLVNCPCGNQQPHAKCCGKYIDDGLSAPTAEALMRSRYTAYTLMQEDYLSATWHPSTRPKMLDLSEDAPRKWLGLTIKNHEQSDNEHAIVEFVARYKVHGRAHRLHEVSRFLYENKQWFYLDGDAA
jgi:SEC-C motif-containing protein